jgi:hypothetical protein
MREALLLREGLAARAFTDDESFSASGSVESFQGFGSKESASRK